MSHAPGSVTARHARRAGFTLLELLVVVALLAILAGVLLPVLAQAREMGRSARCLAQVRQLAQAHALYLQDWDERFPDWRYRVAAAPGTPASYVNWMEYLQPYLRCPVAVADPGAAAPELAPSEGVRLADYALMTWGAGGSGVIEDPYFRWAGPPLGLPEARCPAETILLMDGYTTTVTSRGFEARHHRGVNGAFLDGHARWLPFRELYRVRDGDGFYCFHYASVDR